MPSGSGTVSSCTAALIDAVMRGPAVSAAAMRLAVVGRGVAYGTAFEAAME